MLRTYLLALTAQTALRVVDVGQVVLDGNRPERTLLLTLATTDTADFAGLHRGRTLVLVHAGDVNPPTLRALLTEFDDAARTCLHTGTTGGTLLFVDLRDTCLRIDLDGIELTGSLAVATTQTTEPAGGFTSATGMHSSTTAQT